MIFVTTLCWEEYWEEYNQSPAVAQGLDVTSEQKHVDKCTEYGALL